MKYILKIIWKNYYHASVFLSYGILYPFFYYTSRKPERYLQLNFIRKVWAWYTTLSAGIWFRFRYVNGAKIDSKKTYVICSNHASFIDTNACIILAKGNFHFMGKKELLKNPVLKLLFSTIDVPVDRESKIGAFKAFKKCSDNLKKGMSLIIYPEGGIPEHYPPQVDEFKAGPFRMAIENKVPILPVTFPNNWKVLWDGGEKGMRPGICDIVIHPEIDTSKMNIEDEDNLKEQVRTIIKNTFDKYNQN